MFKTLPPLVIRIIPRFLQCANPWYFVLAEDPRVSQATAAQLSERFVFKNDEKPFIQELFRRKQNLWAFRCDQRSFCGDFVIVDMSSPLPECRRVAVIDLKQGAPLKVGGGGAGVQLKNASLAVEAVAQEFGVVPPKAPYQLLCGDKNEVLRFWGIFVA